MTEEALSLQVGARLAAVHERVAEAALKAGRAPEEITLIGVSKKHSAASIQSALAAGLRDYGENRVQEAQSKWPPLKSQNPSALLHMVGPLQTNKVKDALELFDVFHTVDRSKLAAKLGEATQGLAKKPNFFIQVNTGEEAQKSGVAPKAADDFIHQCRNIHGVEPCGLMCIPPINEEVSLHFALLSKIAERNDLPYLSMGMSADFETAIAFGATHIRVGTAIFGQRLDQ